MKNRWKKLKNLLFNVGLTDEEFDALYPALLEQNRWTLQLVSMIAAVMFALLTVINALMNSAFKSNEVSYIIGFAASLLLYFAAKYLLPSHPKLTMSGTFLFSTLLYALFMYISLLHRNMPAVSFIVFLLVIPLLFVDRTVNLISMTTLFSAIFCVLTYRFKPYAIAFTDIWNVVTFALVAFIEASLLNMVKVRAQYQAGEILRLSRTDILTGTRNRNSYEEQLQVYPSLTSRRLTCIFADVNGLHEVNNRSGHAAGDAMLKTVAE
ncbi:MAG: diguanylate cyclase, partial [Oscillospiraceae bacterium]|nr:diguanylate cyclase [Oscillospiraceae bacterium]